jgi:hypothetical protein
VSEFLTGAAAMAFIGVAGYFYRFWSETRDRFFVWFAFAFLVLAGNQVLKVELGSDNDLAVYVVRLLAFLLIIAAVIDKNLRSTERRR